MDAMNFVGVTSAVLAALALGVLLAYSCCQAMFTLLRLHSRPLLPAASAKAVDTPVQVQVHAS